MGHQLPRHQRLEVSQVPIHHHRSPSMRLSTTLVAAAAAAVIPIASAFSDTAPFLAFTSRQSSLLDRGLVSRSTSSPAVAPHDIARLLTSKSQELCNLDAMIIVEVQELESNAFQTLSADSFLRSRALEAPSQLAFPHVSLSHGNAASEVRNAVQKSCRKAWAGKDNIKTLQLDTLDDQTLATSLSSFMGEFPNNLIIVTSAPPRLQMRKRASDSNSTDSAMDPKLGLLHRYQFFSTGLLVALLVMVLLLIPIVYAATGLLAGIETPDRLGERSRVTGEKKSQ